MTKPIRPLAVFLGASALILSTFFSFPSKAEANPCSGPDQCSEYLVRFTHRASEEAIERVLTENGLSIASEFEETKIYHLIGDPSQSFEETLNRLNADPDVVYAEPNYEIQANSLPNDPYFGNLWAFNNIGQNQGLLGKDIGMDEVWDAFTGSSSLIVAVLDSGVDYGHPDLRGNMWINGGERPGNGIDDDRNGYVDDVYGYNFKAERGDPMDDHFHGTHVAGTIGAVGDNGIGVAGVNWDVRLMALKFLGSDGKGSLSDAIQAISYAIKKGAKVINNSWSFTYPGLTGLPKSPSLEPVQSLRDAIAKADLAGIVFVCAAGNDGRNNDMYPTYPSSYSVGNVVSVAATDSKDGLPAFSNYGPISVDLGAPGAVIFSTFPRWRLNPPYKYLSGTSMSAPHVSGAAALLWAAEPALTHRQVIDRIKQGVRRISPLTGKTVTGGRLDVAQSFALGNPGVNHPPVAYAGPNQLRKVGDTVLLQGHATDQDGDSPLRYFWKLTPPSTSRTVLQNASSATSYFRADVTGTYTAWLWAWDGKEWSLPDTATVSVISSNTSAGLAAEGSEGAEAPSLTAIIVALRDDSTEVDPETGEEIRIDETVTLDASDSFAEGQEDESDHEWAFVEKPFGSEASLDGEDQAVASFRPDLEGRYTIRLTVHSGKLIAEREMSFQAKLETSVDGEPQNTPDAPEMPIEPSPGVGGCSLVNFSSK